MGKKLGAFWTLNVMGLVVSSPALAQHAWQPFGGNGGGPWPMRFNGWGLWWICPFIMFLVIIICVAGCLLSRRSGTAPQNWEPPWRRMNPAGQAGDDRTSSAIRILNERLARGEIQKKEYDEIKDAILSFGQK